MNTQKVSGLAVFFSGKTAQTPMLILAKSIP